MSNFIGALGTQGVGTTNSSKDTGVVPLQTTAAGYLYPVWISGCAMYGWAAFSRKSFGMLANYMLLVTIDTIGLIRIYAV